MIKTIFIPAHFKPIIQDIVENIPTGETKRNWLGSEGTLPKFLDETYEYQINDGHQMGSFAAKRLMEKLMTDTSKVSENSNQSHYL